MIVDRVQVSNIKESQLQKYIEKRNKNKARQKREQEK